jgi:hypothetical protein
MRFWLFNTLRAEFSTRGNGEFIKSTEPVCPDRTAKAPTATGIVASRMMTILVCFFIAKSHENGPEDPRRRVGLRSGEDQYLTIGPRISPSLLAGV